MYVIHLSVGWEGEDCNTAVCKDGCNPRGGSCFVPNTCVCAVGFSGELCNVGMHSIMKHFSYLFLD